jgi:hypothetical protein
MSVGASRPLVAADRRTSRALVALVFGHRERAIILDALGVRGAADWREAATLDGLVDEPRYVEGGFALLESLLRAEVYRGQGCPWTSLALLAEAWDRARRGWSREIAALLFTVATSEGVSMRRLEQRMLDDLEARAWDALRKPRRASSSAPQRGLMVHP